MWVALFTNTIPVEFLPKMDGAINDKPSMTRSSNGVVIYRTGNIRRIDVVDDHFVDDSVD